MSNDEANDSHLPGESLSSELAERVRAEREYLGLRQDQVAKVLGVSRAAISAIETGRRKVSGVELARLAKLFGTSSDRLLGTEALTDASSIQLFRATKDLSDHDKDQVLRFAEFLSKSSAGKPDEQ